MEGDATFKNDYTNLLQSCHFREWEKHFLQLVFLHLQLSFQLLGQTWRTHFPFELILLFFLCIPLGSSSLLQTMNVIPNAEGVKIYNVSIGKSLPQWLTEKKRKSLRYDEGE